MENITLIKDAETIMKEAFLVGQSAKNYYLLNYGIKSQTVNLIISYSGSSALGDSNFHFSMNYLPNGVLQLEFGNGFEDRIIAWERQVKIYFKDDFKNKNTLQFIFNDGSVVNIKTKQDIFDFTFPFRENNSLSETVKYNSLSQSVNDFIIFCS